MTKLKAIRTTFHTLGLAAIGFGIAVPITFHALEATKHGDFAYGHRAVLQMLCFGFGLLLLLAWIMLPVAEDEDPLVGKGTWLAVWFFGLIVCVFTFLSALHP